MSLFNHRTLVLHPDFAGLEDFMISLPLRFERDEGTVIHNGRNQLRRITYQGVGLCGEVFPPPESDKPVCLWRFPPLEGKTLLRPCSFVSGDWRGHSSTCGIYEYPERGAFRPELLRDSSFFLFASV